MSEQDPNPVVLAVGHDPIDAALAFAGAEAAGAGCGLHLVHVVHQLAQGSETVLVAETDLQRIGREALTAARDRAHHIVPATVPVSADLRLGGVVPTLVDVAKDARMIVLERRHLSSMRRVVTRSVSSGVAAHARVPVVSVPSHWSPESTRGDRRIVTVGVDVVERAEQVLRAAAAEAGRRGAELRVIHAWNIPSGYDDIIVTRPEREEWAARSGKEIQAVIDALGEDAAGVPVRIETRHGYPADALIEASRESDLLVIGRHDPLVPIGSHLGPIARAVLREAECPVLLVDPRPARGRKRHSRKPAHATAQPA